MNPETILYIILGISLISYLFDQTLDYLNLKALKPEVPAEIQDFYDTEKYYKSIAYQKEQSRFSFISSAFSFILSFGMLLFGGFGFIDSWLRPFIENQIILALVFFGVIMIVSDIISIPFQWYSTFVIEEKYG
jgi:STE24 endopeptidase